MATLDIDGISLEIDIVAWAMERLVDAKQRSSSWVSACCPFHDDSRPSFAVHIDEGVFSCQACGVKGGFVRLFAHVENMAMDDAEHELIAKYGRVVPDTRKAIELDFGRWGTSKAKGVEEVIEVPSIVYGHSLYLVKRGISTMTQMRYGAGSTLEGNAAMPWFSVNGRRFTSKVRSTTHKAFWFVPDVPDWTRRRTLFGIQLAWDAERLVVTEAEIGALSVAEVDEVAVASGSSNITREQIALLCRIPAKEIVVFHDDDAAGWKMLALVVKGVGSSKIVTMVDWKRVPDVKDRDANGVLRECGPAKVREMIDKRVPAPLTLKFE